MRILPIRLPCIRQTIQTFLIVMWLAGCSLPIGKSIPQPISSPTSHTPVPTGLLKAPGLTTPSVTAIPTEFLPSLVSITTSTRSPTYTPAPSEISGFVVFDDIVDVVHFTSQIFLANLDTGEIQQLTDVGSNNAPIWSPDGLRMAFVSNRDGDFDIYIMDKDGRNETRLTHYKENEVSLDWSPNGQKLAFVSHHSGNTEIYTIDIHTREVRQLTNNAGIDFSPKWSSDGSRIAFISDRIENTYQVYVMNNDGTNVTQLTSDNFPSGTLAWCPDDTCIIYEQKLGLRNRISKLAKIDLESGAVYRLLQGSYETGDSVQEWYPSKSPVRGYISFAIDDLLYAYDIKSDRLIPLGLQAVGAALYP